MKFIYILILISLPLTDIFSQQDVYLSKRDSIKLKKLGIDLFQDDIQHFRVIVCDRLI